MQEVVGSTPILSTKKGNPYRLPFLFFIPVFTNDHHPSPSTTYLLRQDFCFTKTIKVIMKHYDFIGIVPEQYTGKEIQAETFVELMDDKTAKTFFEIVKQKLLCVNNWHSVAGSISAKFQLIDETGKEVNRNARKGDYFKIDIPGPGSTEGDGYDWVCVEDLKERDEEDIQSVGFRVRPSPNPFGSKNEIAHFYAAESTSSFIVTRKNSKISALIVDRNIKPNDHAESATDKVRDVAVGIGAMGMFSKAQWQGLADGLIKKST